ncbi:hypothetical protein EJ110_NYTH30572 [Nymphaea thermarum]|nr:hypothetical protein EJ110_NYTH30572 [Nymphaea thermarum]
MGDPGDIRDPMVLGGAEDAVGGGEDLASSSSAEKGRSWAAIVDRGNPAAKMNLPPLEKKEVAGKRRLVISQQSYQVLCQPFRFSAIATLAGGAGKVGKGMFLLRTSSEEDLKHVLSPGRWYVGGRPLIANQWHLGMPMRIESFNPVRIWIRLLELPVEWWNPQIFTDIVVLIGGSFVEADEYTKHLQRFGFARIKIEIPLGLIPISEIELEVTGGKIFVQTIEYETKVKYCHRCGSTAHFEGSCLVAEAVQEGAKVTANAWQSVKTPKRRPQTIKRTEDVQSKHNNFKPLSHMVEEIVVGENPSGGLGDRVTACETQNVHVSCSPIATDTTEAGNAAGVPDLQITDLQYRSKGTQGPLHNPLAQDNKVKKRALKHREVNGAKKRISPPNLGVLVEKAGGRLQDNRFLAMEGSAQEYMEEAPADDMEICIIEEQLAPEAMADDKADDLPTNKLKSTIAFAIDTKLNSEQLQKFQFKLPNKRLISNIHISGPWARIIALWDPLESALTEVSCPDAKFTLTNNRMGLENVMSKIDRCYVSKEWVDDPDLLVLLEDMAGYRDQVVSAWMVDTRDCMMIKLIHKLETTRDKLKMWCKSGANDLPLQIVELKSKIKLLQSLSESGHPEAIEEECNLKIDLSKLLRLEECLWRQKSRIKWLRDGVLNTKFFQGIANRRRRQNKIASISHDGRLLIDMLEIFTACTDYFVGLLGTSDEIQWAEMEADRDSAPGLDGFGNSFFQRNWNIVQEAIAGTIRGFFDSDDIIFFIDGKLQNLRHMKGCLDEFSSCSGLVMNIDKSSVLSFNMNSQMPSQIERAMGWRQDHWGEDRLIDKVPITHLHLVQDSLTCSVKEIIEVNGEFIMDFLASLNISFTCPRIEAEQPDTLVWKNVDKGLHHGIGAPLTSCKHSVSGIRKASEIKLSMNAEKIASTWRFGLFGEPWTESQQVKTQNWLRTGILWSDGVHRDDTWVEISITSWFKADRKEVACLIRDDAGRFRYGLPCWFEMSSAWQKTEVLLECIFNLANLVDNQGRIYILANDGDWKQHLRSLIECRMDIVPNSPSTNRLFSRFAICKRWPLAEATNLLLLIPDNGLYTKWNPIDTMWDPLKENSLRD